MHGINTFSSYPSQHTGIQCSRTLDTAFPLFSACFNARGWNATVFIKRAHTTVYREWAPLIPMRPATQSRSTNFCFNASATCAIIRSASISTNPRCSVLFPVGCIKGTDPTIPAFP